MLEPSIPQANIYDAIANGSGHIQIRALAGSGKTTTLIGALDYTKPTDKVAFVAFAKAIVQEIESRVPTDRHIKVATLHSTGFGVLRKAYGRVFCAHGSHDKTRKILNETYKDLPSNFFGPAYKAVSLAKAYLAESIEDIYSICEEFDINYSDKDSGLSFDIFVQMILRTLNISKEMTSYIDFDDMIYMPVVQDLSIPKFDWVFGDESQDFNKAQIEFICRMVKTNGRICVVGDPAQAIYGFRGAATGAMDIFKAKMSAKEYPLSVSYRCPKLICELASKDVPEFSAAPNAIDGSIVYENYEYMKENASAGSFILSRKNAPLASLIFGFISQGKKAMIRGKDYGEGLLNVVNNFKEDYSEFIQYVNDWENEEIIRLKKRIANPKTDMIEDKAQCLRIIGSNCKSKNELIDNIKNLFSDVNDKSAIMLSTTHKAKGLESDTVYVLADTYSHVEQEERNLWYVAITRSKNELFIINP